MLFPACIVCSAACRVIVILFIVLIARVRTQISYSLLLFGRKETLLRTTQRASIVGAREKSAWTSLMNFIISPAEVDFLVAMCKYGDLDMDMSLAAGPALCVSPDLCFYSRT